MSCSRSIARSQGIEPGSPLSIRYPFYSLSNKIRKKTKHVTTDSKTNLERARPVLGMLVLPGSLLQRRCDARGTPHDVQPHHPVRLVRQRTVDCLLNIAFQVYIKVVRVVYSIYVHSKYLDSNISGVYTLRPGSLPIRQLTTPLHCDNRNVY